MSREIKFRAWRLDGGMYKPFDLTNLVSDEYAGESWLDCGDGLHIDHRTGWDSLKIMQYTGLKDKHGKEIYEGDIITVFDYCDDGDIITTKASEVKFKNGSFGFKNDITRDFYSFSNCNRPGTSFKIIGNKFENPELITEVKNG